MWEGAPKVRPPRGTRVYTSSNPPQNCNRRRVSIDVVINFSVQEVKRSASILGKTPTADVEGTYACICFPPRAARNAPGRAVVAHAISGTGPAPHVADRPHRGASCAGPAALA